MYVVGSRDCKRLPSLVQMKQMVSRVVLRTVSLLSGTYTTYVEVKFLFTFELLRLMERIDYLSSRILGVEGRKFQDVMAREKRPRDRNVFPFFGMRHV